MLPLFSSCDRKLMELSGLPSGAAAHPSPVPAHSPRSSSHRHPRHCTLGLGCSRLVTFPIRPRLDHCSRPLFPSASLPRLRCASSRPADRLFQVQPRRLTHPLALHPTALPAPLTLCTHQPETHTHRRRCPVPVAPLAPSPSARASLIRPAPGPRRRDARRGDVDSTRSSSTRSRSATNSRSRPQLIVGAPATHSTRRHR